MQAQAAAAALRAFKAHVALHLAAQPAEGGRSLQLELQSLLQYKSALLQILAGRKQQLSILYSQSALSSEVIVVIIVLVRPLLARNNDLLHDARERPAHLVQHADNVMLRHLRLDLS